MKEIRFSLLLLYLLCALSITAQNTKPEIQKDYGICILSGDHLIGTNANQLYPMYSVMKFPQALYVADYLKAHNISLDQQVKIKQEELMTDTWSPMLQHIDKNTTFTYRGLLRLSLAESDNNACDLLFSHCGMPEKVDSFIHHLFFCDIHVVATERQMHDNIALANRNSCTPLDMANLLLWFYKHKADNDYIKEIWNIMDNCNTGADRIPAVVTPDCNVIHKTGTGPSINNQSPAMNDAGIIIYPEGKVKVVTIFLPHPDSHSSIREIITEVMKENND